jgi:hypothetical protein
MNSSLWSADRMTHIKIVAASLALTVIVFVVVGSSVRITDSNQRIQNYIESRPVVAGEPVTLSARDSATIR